MLLRDLGVLCAEEGLPLEAVAARSPGTV